MGVAGLQECVDDDLAGDRGPGGEQVAGVASSQLMISASPPPASAQRVKSDCQHSLGWAAAKRRQEERGRLRGSGATRPAACRIRRVVEADGTCSPACSRCQAMVTGPASQPAAVSSRRVLTMKSRTLPSVARGLLSGLRDRASTASSPAL